jgi:NADH-quinone oxidoreductase subunit A
LVAAAGENERGSRRMTAAVVPIRELAPRAEATQIGAAPARRRGRTRLVPVHHDHRRAHDDARFASRIGRFPDSDPEKSTRVYSATTLPGPVPEPRVTDFYRQYLAVAVFVVAAFVMVGAMLGVARLLRPSNPQDDKYITYESGSDPLPLFGQANVRYYIYALLFVIFDVEAVFIFPWAVDVDGLGWFGLVEMTIFIGVLLLGLAYVWRKGLLKWA